MAQNNSMAKSAMYNMIAKFGQMAIQLVIQMVLARLINAADFGVVAIITVALNFLNMFADMGLGVSIIQKSDLNEDDIGNVFSASMYIGVVLTLIMILLAYPISHIYNNPVYMQLFTMSSIIALFNSLNVVPNALIMREKRFDLVALRTILINAVAGVVAILAAFSGAKYYALVLNYFLSSVGIFIWNYMSTKERGLRIKFKIQIRSLTTFMGKYSLFQFLFNIMNYFTRNLDYLLVGAYMGETTLGYYQKAYTMNLYPNQLFTNVISAVFHPYMRAYKHDYKKMYEKWVEINTLLSVVAATVMCIMFFCSEEIILIMFGDNWKTAIGCLHWLSICVWAQMLSSTCGAVFLSAGRTDQTFKCGVVNVLIILLALAVGLWIKDIDAVAFAIGMAYNIIFLITLLILVKWTLHQRIKTVLKRIVPDFLACLIFMAIVQMKNITIGNNIFARLICKCAIVCAYMLFYLFATRKLNTIYLLFRKTMKSILKK